MSDPADRIHVNLNVYHRKLAPHSKPLTNECDSEGSNTCLSLVANEWWSQSCVLVLIGRGLFLPFVPRRGQCPPALK